MDIEIPKKKYIIRRKYWPYIGGGVVVTGLLIWLAMSNFASTLKVDRSGLNIGDVTRQQFNDYVSLDGNVVPISIVQISPEEGGVVMEKVVDEGAHVNKGDVIIRLSNSSLDLQILNAESELAEKQDMLRNTQINMEQEGLTNKNEKLQQDMDVERKRRNALRRNGKQLAQPPERCALSRLRVGDLDKPGRRACYVSVFETKRPFPKLGSVPT